MSAIAEPPHMAHTAAQVFHCQNSRLNCSCPAAAGQQQLNVQTGVTGPTGRRGRTGRRCRRPAFAGPVKSSKQESSGNYDHWDKWDKSGWVRISRISRIRSGPPQGTYPEKGVLILNTYPNRISCRISQLILTYPYLSYICIVYPGKISCNISCNYILRDIFTGYPEIQYIS